MRRHPLPTLGRFRWRYPWQRLQLWSTVALNHLPPWRDRSIFVLGHPRSGTNWLCRILSHYFQIPIFLLYKHGGFVRGPLILHLHRFAVVPRRTVYILRDGRDVVVSYYFRRLNSLPKKNPEGLKRLERFCPKPLTHENARANLPGMIRYLAEGKPDSSVPYAQHLRTAQRMGLYTIRYEDLLARGEETLAGILEHLGERQQDPHRLRAAFDATRFERFTGRKAGDEDQRASTGRKGIAGDWRNYFTREAAETFDRYAGDALIEAGYEQDHSWVGSVPG